MDEKRIIPCASVCAMRCQLDRQTVPGNAALSLPVWEIHGGEAIRPAGELGLELERGCYLVQFGCQTQAAGAVLTLNGASVSWMEAEPVQQLRTLQLQGLLCLRAPGTLTVRNNAAASGFFSRAVLTVVRL